MTSTPEYGQDELVHRLPRAPIVDRIPWLVEKCRGKSVIHIGFADAGFLEEQRRSRTWLHDHLAAVTSSLTGLDADPTAVDAARGAGFAAHQVDCIDVTAVEALGLDRADVVLAGEVIEHVDAPGPFLDSMHALCRDGGRLVVTTPNAYGLVNVAASVVRRVEINHPDHVVMFTWRTLTELMRRHGWNPVDTATYVPALRERGRRSRGEAVAVRAVLGTERLLGRLGRPFSADGLIVVAEPA